MMSSVNFLLRLATKNDAPAITELLNHYVENSTAPFINERQTVADRMAWFEQRSEKHPAVAVESDRKLIGWGALSPHNLREGYRHSADDWLGRVGGRLLRRIGFQHRFARIVRLRPNRDIS